MHRSELILSTILSTILLAGIALVSVRGGGKSAEVIITRNKSTPYDAAASIPSTVPSAATAELVSSATQDTVSIAVLQYLNHAGSKQLMEIPGIGEVTATSILTYRSEIGFFTSTDQLLDVKGIGESKRETILQYVESLVQRVNVQPVVTPAVRAFPTRQYIQPATLSNTAAKIPLNHATKQQLMQVSGIGPSIADNIINERAKRKNGFQSWGDVDSVSGIGEQRLELLQSHFSIE